MPDSPHDLRAMTRHLPVQTRDGFKLVARNALDSMTTYVMLEQEQWFEQEVAFIRACARPGMHALDIGANHGVYSLLLAAGMQGAGHVWAFEPTSEPFALFSESVRLNGLSSRITPVNMGLSDHAREARMTVSHNSELNTLHGGAGDGENVRLHPLDEVLPGLTGGAVIDFVKLDAEGEELRILDGAARFFSERSPLVMFEIKHGTDYNTGLWEAFVRLGYGLYIHVPGPNLLRPMKTSEAFEPYQLNLFAAKPARAAALSALGLLVETDAEASRVNADADTARDSADAGADAARAGADADVARAGADAARIDWQIRFQAMPYAASFMRSWTGPAQSGNEGVRRRHLANLERYLASLDNDVAAPARLHLLQEAVADWRLLRQAAPTQLSIALCLARACNDLGHRSEALNVLIETWRAMHAAAADAFSLPFLPPAADFDLRAPQGNLMDWLVAALLEAYESWRTFSSYFNTDTAQILAPHLANPNLSAALRRRYVLHTRRAGALPLPGADQSLRIAANDNHNPAYWTPNQAASPNLPPELLAVLHPAR